MALALGARSQPALSQAGSMGSFSASLRAASWGSACPQGVQWAVQRERSWAGQGGVTGVLHRAGLQAGRGGQGGVLPAGWCACAPLVVEGDLHGRAAVGHAVVQLVLEELLHVVDGGQACRLVAVACRRRRLAAGQGEFGGGPEGVSLVGGGGAPASVLAA